MDGVVTAAGALEPAPCRFKPGCMDPALLSFAAMFWTREGGVHLHGEILEDPTLP